MSIYRNKDELAMKEKIDELFVEWHSKINACKTLPVEVKESFVSDGFYPGYLSQKVKVLFLGRESLSVDGDFMECLYEAYRTGYVGGKHINKYQMHYLQFYVAYGFNNGFPNWSDKPFAYELAQKMGEEGGVSFAFINVSKFSNWSDDWKLDYALVGRSLSQSKEAGFLARQIEILNPDVICSMNVLGIAGDQIGQYEYVAELSNADVSVHDYHFSSGKTVPLLDMWHYSAPRKSPELNYYNPLAMGVRKLSQRYPQLAVSL